MRKRQLPHMVILLDILYMLYISNHLCYWCLPLPCYGLTLYAKLARDLPPQPVFFVIASVKTC